LIEREKRARVNGSAKAMSVAMFIQQ